MILIDDEVFLIILFNIKQETIVIGIVFDEAVDLFNEKFMPFKSYYTSNAVVQEVQPRFVIDAIKI